MESSIGSVPEDYPYRDNLGELNAYLGSAVLDPLVKMLRMDKTIRLFVLPTYAVDPLIVVSAAGDPVILFDHIAIILAQLYFRSILICSSLVAEGEGEKTTIYYQKIYSVLVKVYSEREQLAKSVMEINGIEESLGINQSLDDYRSLLHGAFCAAFEQFLLLRTLSFVRSDRFISATHAKRQYPGGEIDVVEMSPDCVSSFDVDGLSSFYKRIGSMGIAIGLEKELAISATMAYFTIVALLEKNGAFQSGAEGYRSARDRLSFIRKSLSGWRYAPLKKAVDDEIETVDTLPDLGYLSFMDMAFGAIMGGAKPEGI